MTGPALSGVERAALEYVKNANGGATWARFIDDHAPVGAQLWVVLVRVRAVQVDAQGRLLLTDAGRQILEVAA